MTMLPLIRSVVTAALPKLFNESATLHVFTEGTIDTGPTYVNHTLTEACFRDSRQIGLRGVGVIQADEGAILFYREKIPASVTLKVNDEVTFTDPIDSASKRYKLLRLVDEDPASATQLWATAESNVDA